MKITSVDTPEPGFYGEWVYYDTDEEKKDALEYLRLWKIFFLKKLSMQCVNEMMIEREIIPHEFLKPKGKYTLGIKIEVK